MYFYTCSLLTILKHILQLVLHGHSQKYTKKIKRKLHVLKQGKVSFKATN